MDFVVISQSDYLDDDTSELNDKGFVESVDYGKWEIPRLKKECRNFGLEQFYNVYIQRVQRSFLSLFFVLQTMVNITHVIIVASMSQSPSDINPDIFCYTFPLLVVWISLFATFKEDLVNRYPAIPYISSCIAIFALIAADLTIPLYHAVNDFIVPPLRPAYAAHLLFVIYLFLPLADNWHAVLMGFAATGSYLSIYIFVTYRLDDERYIKVTTEALFLISVNFFGLYNRLMNEIAIRKAFLDRRECVEGNLLLKFARNQENDLLLSILPEHTAEALEKDITELIRKIRTEKRKASPRMYEPTLDVRSRRHWPGHAINKLYVEEYKDVSILYADVVNYTQITTQLPVRNLVETLHELFVKFDEASKEFNVLRIKFLGDCYYCVSGVPKRNKRHAKSCVDLGLRMIRDIRDVRHSRHLEIDMRIGVHSGSIIAGVVGACKWQYDIWSRDVNIANRMESTGQPGKVHVTGQTLALLDNEYIYETGTEAALRDPVLTKHSIVTYLIGPQYYGENSFYLGDDGYSSRLSVGVKRKTMSRRSRTMDYDPSNRRNFMQNSMEQFREIMKQTNVEMARELDKMPIGKFNFNKLFVTKASEERRITEEDIEQQDLANISTYFLCFEEKKWELTFLQQPDSLLKYSTLMVVLVFVMILGMQILNKPPMSSFGWVFWATTIICGLILFSLLPITWFKNLWDQWRRPAEDAKTHPPSNSFLAALYRTSNDVTKNATARHVIYLLSVGILITCSLVHLVGCSSDLVYPTNILNSTFNEVIINRLRDHSPCMNPWFVTQCIIMTICVGFLFLRIHFLLKMFVGICILTAFGYVVFIGLDYMFENSASVNPALDPKIAHFLTIIFTSIIFHLVDRNAEYISKIDYNWKQQLLKKHEEAEVTKETNKILVQNILPAHVAEIYINQQLKNEFYNEEYDNVAVMFATITNFDIATDTNVQNEKNILNVLNGIICDFDEVLLSHTGSQKIEKIKVSGWTYMAACGLDPGREDSSADLQNGIRNITSTTSRTSLMTNGRRSFRPIVPSISHSVQHKSSQRHLHSVVITLCDFALKLMRTLQHFNEENFQETSPGMLRIGISHGKVMAGVVGSSKPLYDVWGNCVNMASRMDSCGVPGRIQVTADTAEIVKNFGYKVEYRGETYVKGRGIMPTYFLSIDENLNFVKEERLNSIFEHA